MSECFGHEDEHQHAHSHAHSHYHHQHSNYAQHEHGTDSEDCLIDEDYLVGTYNLEFHPGIHREIREFNPAQKAYPVFWECIGINNAGMLQNLL